MVVLRECALRVIRLVEQEAVRILPNLADVEAQIAGLLARVPRVVESRFDERMGLFRLHPDRHGHDVPGVAPSLSARDTIHFRRATGTREEKMHTAIAIGLLI